MSFLVFYTFVMKFLPAIFLSRIFLHSCSAFLMGQFSTFALKLLKNLYSLKCDILLSILLGVWPGGGGEGALGVVDGEGSLFFSIFNLIIQLSNSNSTIKFGFLNILVPNLTLKLPFNRQLIFCFTRFHFQIF